MVPAHPLSPEIDTQVDAVWRMVSRERPHLFDGPVMTVVSLDGDRIVLAHARYRQVLAAQSNSLLHQSLALRTLAVSGILSCADGFVFGRRGRHVTQSPGQWELVPSGTMEAPSDGSAPDFSRQILRELHEEIGLAEGAVVRAPLGAIEDTEIGVIDVVLPIFTKASGSDVIAAHRKTASNEYIALHITQCPHAFASARSEMVSVTGAILDHFVPQDAT